MSRRPALVGVCPHLGDGGAQRVLAALLSGWAASGRAVELVTLGPEEPVVPLHPDVRWTELLGGAQRWLLEHRPRREAATSSRGAAAVSQRPAWRRDAGVVARTAARSAALRALLVARRPEAVLSFCASANVVTLLATARSGVRTVVSERNDPTRQFVDHPFGLLRRRLYRRADAVTANSHGAVEALGAYVPHERLHYVPNPLLFAPERGEVAPAAEDREALFLIVARLSAQKRHAVLIEALARLPADLAHWRLAVVGRGELEATLRRHADAHGVGHRIDWVGEVPDPRPCLRRAAVFVLPSRHEGTPNALLEAMSFGVPGIVTDTSSGARSLVESGGGVVVPADDVDRLTAAMLRLARDPAERARMGAAARAAAAAAAPDLGVLLGRWGNLLWPSRVED